MKRELYDLTSSQDSIWLTEEYISNTSINNMGGYLYIDSKVDFDALNEAINLFIKYNDAPKLRFCIEKGIPKQYLVEYSPIQFDLVSLNSTEEAKELAQKEINTPFNIVDSKLFNFVMFKLPDGSGGFTTLFHHLISDAWNISLFLSEVMDYYSSITNQREIDSNFYPSYIDYIKSENEYKSSNRFQKDHDFWNSLFDTEPVVSHISPNSNISADTLAKRITFNLDTNIYSRISEFCKNNNCSIYTFFMTIYSLYIAKINNNHSPIVGTPVLNRTNFKEKHTSGMFISTVPFKTTFTADESFADYLNDVALAQLSIFRHQKYPYDMFLKEIKDKYNFSENLYDLVLSYQNAKDNKQNSDVSYSTHWIFSGYISNTLEIHFYDMDNTGTFDIYYDYQVAKLDEKDIYNIHDRILEMISFILDNPQVEIKDIPVITHAEADKFLNDFNYTGYEYDKELPLIQLFEENVKTNPSKTAIVFQNNKMSYEELNNKANIIADILINKGVKRNDIVGIMLNRSFETLVSVFGTLKAGAGYMLIDPALPQDRIEYMLSNAKAKTLITTSSMEIEYEDKLLIDTVDFNKEADNPNAETNNEDAFCVIYTSGSTGTPKGVELKRIGVINMVNSYKKFLYTDTCENFLSTSTVAFDMFIVENFVSLLSGKTVILTNEEEQKIPAYTSELIKKYNVDFILSTPSKIELLLLNDETKSSLKNVKIIQLGGEVFKDSLYKRLRECSNAKIFNGYGPSECTACASNKEITDSENITIGIPFLNTRIYILNDDLNILPIGYTGEICICGDGVGKGYINNEEITKKSFVKDIYSDSIMYKTGDMGKYAEDGNIIYIGRRDAQVKLRGLRIELDEITNRITKINGIINAVSVIKKVNNIDCICSYVIKSSDITEEQIQDNLKHSLPYYMIPSHIVFMDSFPITLNGKIDTKKLPDIQIQENSYTAPKTDTEIKLSKLWNEILEIEKISTDSNFFNLGGDSLCSIKLVSEVYSEFGVKINIKDIFQYSTIKSLAKHIDSLQEKKKQTSTAIAKAPIQDSYPLSSAQIRIYFTINMDPNTITYNTPGALLFDKCPDATKLENAINTVLNNHCAFRTYFEVNQDDDVKQKLIEKIDFKLNVINEKEKDLEQIFNSFLKPFDLSKAPLFRAELHVFSDNSAALFIDIHHIICDGESISLFVNELCNLYNGLRTFSSDIDYIDYSVWENNNLNSEEYKKNKSYWLRQFEGELPVLNMPTNYSRPVVQSFEGSKVYATIPQNKKVEEFCKKYNCTPYSLLLTVYYTLLYKYTNQTDIIVGSPIVGRERSEFYNIIGMFVNTLALRTNIDSNSKFADYLRINTANLFTAFEHQTYPFDELVKDLNISRDTSRNPLFDTMFIYQNNGNPQVHLNGIDTEYYIPDNHSSKFDFSLEIIPEGNDLKLNLEYCTKLFDKNFMDKFLKHYINILDIILDNPNIQISEINMLSDEEKDLILNKYNQNSLDYPSDKSIFELFEEIAKNNNNTAIIYNDQKISYEELYEKVNEFSAYLISQGIKKGEIVATLLKRSSNLIIAMLGAMKCGAIYLPISTELPQDRINYILSNSNAKTVVVDNSSPNLVIDNITKINIDEIHINDVETNIKEKILPDDILYIIYTSGSTGAPKGVKITNKNLNNFIHSFKNLFDNSVNNDDICLSTTNISFDVSMWEFFFTLLNGATLYLYPHENIEDIFDYCKTIVDNKITMAYLPPNILEEVYSILSGYDVSLNKILIGVEPIKVELMKKYFSLSPNMRIVNGYGPTETTICCTAFVFSKNKNIPYDTIPIGKPLHNLQAYVLDKDLQPVPFGVSGELYICGDNVGKGYLNNEKMTKERYIPCKYNHNQIMYKTGDVVKLNEDGNLSFIGRNDNQIKIKGHRIELNEISNTILKYPTITKCQVIVKEENDNKYLVAYFTASKKIVINDLRSFLSSKLPFYSIPNLLIQLDKFVLTVNGKIDTKYLNNLSVSISSEYEEPHTDLEKKLVELWKQFLKVDKIGINDNFFELGGDSLIAIKLQIEIFKLGININYSDIFTHPTIKELANKTSTVVKQLDIENYDYSNINKLIEKNSEPIDTDANTVKLENVLLVGVTGFVGIHILDELLSNTTANVYCLIRKKNNIDITSRLIKTLHFYFENKYDSYIGNRIKIIEGDIAKPHFGLLDNKYDKLGNKISCVINSAAIVKHYGSQDLFDKTNIEGVQNIIDFCKKFDVKLYHISTLSVSGNVFAEDSFNASQVKEKTTFRENNLYINQDLSNIYIHTKFIAERLILENVANNELSAIIIRLGNITNRYSDGKFQINISENAFLNRLISFMKLKCIPDYLKTGYLEFTPVDICANAIVQIIQNNLKYTILHLFNNKHLDLTKMVDFLNEYGLEMHFVDNKEFVNIINDTLENNNNILSGIINDFDSDKILQYESDVKLDNHFSNLVLRDIGFEWPEISKEYIFKYLNYLKNIGYIS